jgi:hypothetical protein
MSERPGSKQARELFDSEVDLTEWFTCLRSYDNAVAAVAGGKSKSDLVAWDSFLWNDLVTAVGGRSPKHLTLAELADIMKWKLARGKARPLQKLLESNSPAAVKACSTEAFAQLQKGNWEAAINAITGLKAVGVATATAVFAPFAPSLIPFMADEVMEAASCKRDYTMKVYKEMRSALISKATQLQAAAKKSKFSHVDWTAEEVGKALWVRAMMEVYPAINKAAAHSHGATLAGGKSGASGLEAEAEAKEGKSPAARKGGLKRASTDDSSATVGKKVKDDAAGDNAKGSSAKKAKR